MCRHFGIDTSEYSFGYIAGWSSGKDMKELKSSLDTIRRTASELITGIEGQIKEIQREREASLSWEMMQGQEKECLLLIQNSSLSEYSLVSVRGMDAAEAVEALSAMSDDDRLSIAAYLESRGAWVTEIAGENTKEPEEYHPDVRYNTDTNEVTSVKTGTELNERPEEPIGVEDAGADKEAQLLHGSSDKYGIYQLKDNPELDQFRFEGTEALKRMGITKYNFDAIRPENYNLIYVGGLSELQGRSQGETLEAVYEKFNIDHPADYRGHSLSVSDIVVLHEGGENSAHFVDSFGFTRLPDFMHELEGVKEKGREETTLTEETGQEVSREETQGTFGHDVQKQEKTEITLTVAECGEFHSLGKFHENIRTVEEALAIWRRIPPERISGIPAIGINIHTPGTEPYEDVAADIYTGIGLTLISWSISLK